MVGKSVFVKWPYQLLIMLKRNLLIQIRFWRSTVIQAVGAPILFMLLLFVLQQADYQNQKIANINPASRPLEGVYLCTVRVFDQLGPSSMY